MEDNTEKAISKRDNIVCPRCGSFIGEGNLDICPICGSNLCGNDYEKEN